MGNEAIPVDIVLCRKAYMCLANSIRIEIFSYMYTRILKYILLQMNKNVTDWWLNTMIQQLARCILLQHLDDDQLLLQHLDGPIHPGGTEEGYQYQYPIPLAMLLLSRACAHNTSSSPTCRESIGVIDQSVCTLLVQLACCICPSAVTRSNCSPCSTCTLVLLACFFALPMDFFH